MDVAGTLYHLRTPLNVLLAIVHDTVALLHHPALLTNEQRDGLEVHIAHGINLIDPMGQSQ
jgi:hypothetical protein